MSFSLVWKLASHLRLTYILSPKNIESKATLDRKKFGSERLLVKNIHINYSSQQIYVSKEMLGPTNWCVHKIYVKKNVYKTYRVSTKTVPTFVSWYSRLPRGLEIPSWDIFQQHFLYRFQKNKKIFIIWWNLDQDIGKILHGINFKS